MQTAIKIRNYTGTRRHNTSMSMFVASHHNKHPSTVCGAILSYNRYACKGSRFPENISKLMAKVASAG
jgi:hypothetical protein